MDNKNNNKLIIILLFIIIAILSILCVLFATGTITLNNNENKDNSNNVINKNDNENNSENIKDIKLNILSIDKAIVNMDGVNTKLAVTGTMNLELDDNNYTGLSLIGFCVGNNNEKYNITGPANGPALFHNDDTTFYMAESSYYENVDWSNVKIKSCTIEKANIYSKTNNEKDDKIIQLNFKKDFE